jgi:hypothetical protein
MLPAHPFVPFVERTSMDKRHAPLSVPVRRLGPTTALRTASGNYWSVNFTVPKKIALKGRADFRRFSPICPPETVRAGVPQRTVLA